MKIRLLFFAGSRRIFGKEEMTIFLTPGATVGSVEKELFRNHQDGAGLSPSIRWAVNQEFASLKTQLVDGDEVALLPPVSGG